jgi:cytochrome P450
LITVLLQQVSSTRGAFKKDTDGYDVLKVFGSNLLVTEGEEWKRQRRICAPAFSDVCISIGSFGYLTTNVNYAEK